MSLKVDVGRPLSGRKQRKRLAAQLRAVSANLEAVEQQLLQIEDLPPPRKDVPPEIDLAESTQERRRCVAERLSGVVPSSPWLVGLKVAADDDNNLTPDLAAMTPSLELMEDLAAEHEMRALRRAEMMEQRARVEADSSTVGRYVRLGGYALTGVALVHVSLECLSRYVDPANPALQWLLSQKIPLTLQAVQVGIAVSRSANDPFSSRWRPLREGVAQLLRGGAVAYGSLLVNQGLLFLLSAAVGSAVMGPVGLLFVRATLNYATRLMVEGVVTKLLLYDQKTLEQLAWEKQAEFDREWQQAAKSSFVRPRTRLGQLSDYLSGTKANTTIRFFAAASLAVSYLYYFPTSVSLDTGLPVVDIAARLLLANMDPIVTSLLFRLIRHPIVQTWTEWSTWVGNEAASRYLQWRTRRMTAEQKRRYLKSYQDSWAVKVVVFMISFGSNYLRDIFLFTISDVDMVRRGIAAVETQYYTLSRDIDTQIRLDLQETRAAVTEMISRLPEERQQFLRDQWLAEGSDMLQTEGVRSLAQLWKNTQDPRFQKYRGGVERLVAEWGEQVSRAQEWKNLEKPAEYVRAKEILDKIDKFGTFDEEQKVASEQLKARVTQYEDAVTEVQTRALHYERDWDSAAADYSQRALMEVEKERVSRFAQKLSAPPDVSLPRVEGIGHSPPAGLGNVGGGPSLGEAPLPTGPVVREKAPEQAIVAPVTQAEQQAVRATQQVVQTTPSLSAAMNQVQSQMTTLIYKLMLAIPPSAGGKSLGELLAPELPPQIDPNLAAPSFKPLENAGELCLFDASSDWELQQDPLTSQWSVVIPSRGYEKVPERCLGSPLMLIAASRAWDAARAFLTKHYLGLAAVSVVEGSMVAGVGITYSMNTLKNADGTPVLNNPVQVAINEIFHSTLCQFNLLLFKSVGMGGGMCNNVYIKTDMREMLGLAGEAGSVGEKMADIFRRIYFPSEGGQEECGSWDLWCLARKKFDTLNRWWQFLRMLKEVTWAVMELLLSNPTLAPLWVGSSKSSTLYPHFQVLLEAYRKDKLELAKQWGIYTAKLFQLLNPYTQK